MKRRELSRLGARFRDGDSDAARALAEYRHHGSRGPSLAEILGFGIVVVAAHAAAAATRAEKQKPPEPVAPPGKRFPTFTWATPAPPPWPTASSLPEMDRSGGEAEELEFEGLSREELRRRFMRAFS